MVGGVVVVEELEGEKICRLNSNRHNYWHIDGNKPMYFGTIQVYYV